MKDFKGTYIIGAPHHSETRGLAGQSQTTDWYDKKGHFVGSQTNGSGNPRRWEGKSHAEYIAALKAK